MDMKKFADFWRGMFYLFSTVTMGIVLYLMVVVWQPLWTAGFADFGNISQAIGHLDETTKPASDMAPRMLEQMTLMNQNMQLMNQNVAQMRFIMGYQMGSINHQMDQMNDKFSPFGMMPFNW
ncbi:MAG: hypothetical protein PHE17_04180 [Thiothrix sp.]|uniref:hypothetical protein n=1 Tax=Thiothrix sp. TaxID=1032 RepID=UPI002629DBC8|nr:hypothetical protein [Thiothrix sp.]MDD5392196.1 hypothetical protein [Thiothrix sp.]